MKISIDLSVEEITDALIEKHGAVGKGEYDTTISFITDSTGVVGAKIERVPRKPNENARAG